MSAEQAQLTLDNFEQLSADERARALMTMVRNILWQVENDGSLTPDDVHSHITSVGRDHHCT